MAINQKLYRELERLRAAFKEEGKRQTGRAPLVCSDEALYAIAEMCPRKMSDLEGIPGIGRTFIDTYGKYFIEIINKYEITDAEKTVDMSNKATETLKELEKKLVSINRRNRLLYMPKMSNKYAYDLLSNDSINPLDIIFGNGSPITICDLSNTDLVEGKRFKNVVSLLREINKDMRDRGQNDLYVGYPFVIGRIPGENFDVRCPLALFPVKADRTSNSITICLDETRDILYNSTLLLAYFKFNNITKPLPQAVVDDVDREDFLATLISYYERNDIHIKLKDNCLKKFKEYRSGEFPQFNAGELLVEQNVVLGKFPVCSSSIQKDFDAMLEEGQINNLLNELLLEVNDWDYESDAYYGDVEKKDNVTEFQITEKNLTYINDLDSSQESVLTAINSMDKLVIQGPPGTGKSQVITSLIAKFVNEGKTVLMVSEKKTALDVVYSRLGSLSKYALLIDDVGNKELFYRQLESMVYLGRTSQGNVERTDTLADEIDAKIKLLEKIAAQLYKVSDFGIEPYKLYIQCNRIDMSNPEELNAIRKIHGLLNSQIKEICYDELTAIHKRFSNEELLEKINLYYRIIKQFPWIVHTVRTLGQLDLLDLDNAYKIYKEIYDEYMNKNAIIRFFTKRRIKRPAIEFIKKYFYQDDGSLLKKLMTDPEEIKTGFEQYMAYEGLYPIYEQLNNNERVYADILFEISNLYNTLIAANAALYNAILYENIIIFEALNKETLATISNYSSVIRELSQAIEKKKKLTRTRLEAILSQSMGNITYAKRNGEIRRVIESKRKWSVSRFISKFSFELFKGIKIWLLTPEVVSEIIPLEPSIFDLVIFDEASQMYVEKGLPSIHRAKKVIIAGDHKQLRPSNLGSGRMEFDDEELGEDEETSAALEEESLLDLARFKYQDVMLNFHYRSRYEELIAFSNYAFYKGRLYVAPNVEHSKKAPIEFHLMKDAIWSDRSNIVEAKYIVALLKDIFRDRKHEETIGIITFNSNQKDLIMDLIDEQCVVDTVFAAQVRAESMREQDGEDIGLFIKNIESVQGDERDIIIFSIGYAKNENGRLIRNFGWLNQKGGENRLNVAISRAKRKVHIVASFLPDELQVEDTKNDGPRILKKYLQYAKCISDGDKNGAKQILHSFGDEPSQKENITFDSEFEIQVYNALNERLSDKGYVVDTQVGIGGYSIDLAIKRGDKYLLGIECDGRMYHSSKSARERDYHRQKYLESRGWRIHRIWSTNWWKNPNGEVDKICKVVETL